MCDNLLIDRPIFITSRRLLCPHLVLPPKELELCLPRGNAPITSFTTKHHTHHHNTNIMAKYKRKYLARGSSGCNENDDNPLLKQQQHFLNSLSPQVRSHFFSSTHVTPAERAEVWEKQADLGEALVNSFAWATPDHRLLKIFQHFGPIVEVGCGANAYWSKWMNSR